MSRFYEIHGEAISRACNDVRPGETFVIQVSEPVVAYVIKFRRSYDGIGCFVTEGHRLIDDFNERHRKAPTLTDQIKDATAHLRSLPLAIDPEAAGRSSG